MPLFSRQPEPSNVGEPKAVRAAADEAIKFEIEVTNGDSPWIKAEMEREIQI